MATSLAPLYQVLKQNERWKWTTVEQATFRKAKDLLISQVLVHYDPDEEIVACDASESGIGAVLSHRQPDGTEKNLSDLYHERSLTQKNGIHKWKKRA